jgi:hypothetical protein
VQKRLSRALVELVREDVWAGGAALGSLLLTLGLLAFRITQRPAARLAAKTTASVAVFLLAVCLVFTAAARQHRRMTEPAVVVASEARLLDGSGAPIAQRQGQPEVVAIPEGARVDVVQRRGTLVKVEWGTSSGFVTPGQLRILSLAHR